MIFSNEFYNMYCNQVCTWVHGGDGEHLENLTFSWGVVGGRVVVLNVSTHVPKNQRARAISVGDDSYEKLMCYQNQFLCISSLVNFRQKQD